MKHKWNNVPGTITGAIEIDYVSSGYYDPGRIGGDPDRAYPPECDDERTITAIAITINDREWILDAKVPAEKLLIDQIAGQFQEQIDEEELDPAKDYFGEE